VVRQTLVGEQLDSALTSAGGGTHRVLDVGCGQRTRALRRSTTGRNLTYDGLAARTVDLAEQTQRRRGWHPGPVDAEHRTQRSTADGSPSLRLPRLLGPVQRVVRVSTLLYRGVPRLEEYDLVQRRGFLVRRVHLRMAAFDVLPGRPGRVLLAAEHGRTVVQVELLRVWDTGGRSRTPAELDALAAAVGPTRAALLSALQLQATHLRSSFGPPERSPLAAYAGQSGTVLSEIADTIGGLP